MVRRIALLATVLLSHCGGCSGCGAASSRAPDAAPRAAAPTASVAPGAARPSASVCSSAAASPDASMPAWPPQGPACATFTACCEAVKPQPAARTVCMLSYDESRDCARATASFVRKLKMLGAPVPDACRTPH